MNLAEDWTLARAETALKPIPPLSRHAEGHSAPIVFERLPPDRGPSFNLTEQWKFQIRGEWVNILNHRKFGAPITTMTARVSASIRVNPARTAQVIAKLRF